MDRWTNRQPIPIYSRITVTGRGGGGGGITKLLWTGKGHFDVIARNRWKTILIPFTLSYNYIHHTFMVYYPHINPFFPNTLPHPATEFTSVTWRDPFDPGKLTPATLTFPLYCPAYQSVSGSIPICFGEQAAWQQESLHSAPVMWVMRSIKTVEKRVDTSVASHGWSWQLPTARTNTCRSPADPHQLVPTTTNQPSPLPPSNPTRVQVS